MSPTGITPIRSQAFADFNTPYDSSRYVLVGVPFDGTTSFRPGTRDGPGAIRGISYNFESYVPEYGLDLGEVPVHDIGDLEIPVSAEEVVAIVDRTVSALVSDGKIPIILGGEHTITAGAVRAVHPEVCVICDAHLDLRSEYRGTRYNHACTTRLIYDYGVKEIFIIGARSGTREQYAFAEGLHLYPADQIRENGIAGVIDELMDYTGRRRMYLSVDADVIDCCFTPGLGTPEPFGLTPGDIRDLIISIGPLAAGFDYTEVCPCDHGETAAVAAELIRIFIAAHWSAENRS
jgi:agmatinase